MPFAVNIAAAAERDLEQILEWLLENQAGESGMRWLDGLQQAIASLADTPGRCSLAPENTAFSFEVRHLFYGNRPHVYRILFTIQDQVVTVLHVRHGRRLPLT